MSHASRPAEPLVSRFAGDPEMADMVCFFLDELPARVEAIKSAWAARELRLLSRLAQTLGGSGAGYGFPEIRDAASAIGAEIRTAAPTRAPDLEAIDAQVAELVGLCSRACAGR